MSFLQKHWQTAGLHSRGCRFQASVSAQPDARFLRTPKKPNMAPGFQRPSPTLPTVSACKTTPLLPAKTKWPRSQHPTRTLSRGPARASRCRPPGHPTGTTSCSRACEWTGVPSRSSPTSPNPVLGRHIRPARRSPFSILAPAAPPHAQAVAGPPAPPSPSSPMPPPAAFIATTTYRVSHAAPAALLADELRPTRPHQV